MGTRGKTVCTGGERIGCCDSGVCMGLELPPSSCVGGLLFQECHWAHDDFVSSPAVLLTHGRMPVVNSPFSEEYCQDSGNLSWVQHASFPEHTVQCPAAMPLPDSSALPHLLKFRLVTIWASIPGCSGPLNSGGMTQALARAQRSNSPALRGTAIRVTSLGDHLVTFQLCRPPPLKQGTSLHVHYYPSQHPVCFFPSPFNT